jgi:hypothetical protein
MKHTAIMAFCALLTACAAPPSNSPYREEAMAPLTCDNKAQCDLYWQRAQAWVSRNSPYRIQIANDVLLETYTGTQASLDYAVRLLRERNSNGSERISIAPQCQTRGNPLLTCTRDIFEFVASFKRYVKS